MGTGYELKRPMHMCDVAKATGFSPATIRRAVKAGGLRGHVLVGTKMMCYSEQDVQDWLDGRESDKEVSR